MAINQRKRVNKSLYGFFFLNATSKTSDSTQAVLTVLTVIVWAGWMLI